jgi:hypothetical protein
MLAAMLELIDREAVYDQSSRKQPVLVLDGHGSRMKLPFLKYISDPAHPWTVCLGFPYGTHIWQVGDAPELNGCFKTALYRSKREYLQYKTVHNFTPTNIIPLVNMAWERSFARSENARKAIRKRGWFPLNYVLLDHPVLIPLPPTEEEVTAEVTDSDTDEKISFTVSSKGGKAKHVIGSFMTEAAKSSTRKRKYEEQQQQKVTQEDQAKLLRDSGSLTSGQLAIHNVWTLGGDILQKVQDKEDVDQQKKDEI